MTQLHAKGCRESLRTKELAKGRLFFKVSEESRPVCTLIPDLLPTDPQDCTFLSFKLHSLYISPDKRLQAGSETEVFVDSGWGSRKRWGVNVCGSQRGM